MLHAWEKFGSAKAAEEHFSKYSHKKPKSPEAAFRHRVEGMVGYVGMVKGKSSTVYCTLHDRLAKVTGGTTLSHPVYKDNAGMVVYCEGKTDPVHLRAALKYFHKNGMFTDLNVSFHLYNNQEKVSNSTLYDIYAHRSILKDNGKIEVYLLDSDDSRFTGKARAEGRDYVRSDNNVYLAVLPKPDHRSFDTVCIEHYYIDEDLMREDKAGRRIYLSREFDRETGFHLENKELRSGKLSVLSKSDHEIITDSVLDRHDCNHALSKNDFAKAVSGNAKTHRGMDFSHFKVIFNMLLEIQSKGHLQANY